MAGGLEQSPYFKTRANLGKVVVNEAPKFSLETYINEYSGRTRLERLAHIGTSSTFLCLDALTIAIREARRNGDVSYYVSLHEVLQELQLPPDVVARLPKDIQDGMDVAWAERQSKIIKAETDRLETELRTYKNNLIKESIRMGNEELGKHYYNTGDYVNAAKAYGRMRDYCTTQKHIADMTLRLVFVSAAQKNWNSVQSFCAKLHSVTLKPDERERLDPIEHACLGLASLAMGHYDNAAGDFLRVDPAYVVGEPEAGVLFRQQVMTGNDVAIYGGLCALASFDRRDLQRRVLDNAGFRQFLELEPHVRRAVSAFVQGKYSACLRILDAYRADYLLDVHLARHVDELYARVRSKSIVQYFIPFSCVTLAEMERAFPSKDGGSIEDELVGMIQRGVLNARIDLVDKVLIAPQSVPRTAVQTAALGMAKQYERNLRLRLLRVNMLNAGLEVKAPKSNKPGYDISGLVDDNYSSAGGRTIGTGRRSSRQGG